MTDIPEWHLQVLFGVSFFFTSMKLTKIKLNSDDRMLRIGFGKNKGNWFARIDVWFVGFRLTR